MAKVLLAEFESIGKYYANLLEKNLDVKYVDDFYGLKFEDVLKATQAEETRVQQWYDILDLYRVPKIKPRIAELLYYININSVEELSHRRATRIFYRFKNLDEETYFIILQYPSFSEINKWIYYAKLMVKKVENGLNIPLILFPMVNTDVASELQKYMIWTVEDLVARAPLIPKLHKRIHLTKKDYTDLLKMVRLIMVNGIDIEIAKVLFEKGLDTPETIIKKGKDNLVSLLQPMVDEERVIMILENIKQLQS